MWSTIFRKRLQSQRTKTKTTIRMGNDPDKEHDKDNRSWMWAETLKRGAHLQLSTPCTRAGGQDDGDCTTPLNWLHLNPKNYDSRTNMTTNLDDYESRS